MPKNRFNGLSHGPMSDHSSSSFVPLCFAWLKSCASNFCRERTTTSPCCPNEKHHNLLASSYLHHLTMAACLVITISVSWKRENLRPVSLLWRVCGCRSKWRTPPKNGIDSTNIWVTESQLAFSSRPQENHGQISRILFMEIYGYTLNATSPQLKNDVVKGLLKDY